MDLTPLIYQFLVGGVIFTLGIAIPWLAGDYSWRRREDRLTVKYMLAGFIIYLAVQVIWHCYGGGVI